MQMIEVPENLLLAMIVLIFGLVMTVAVMATAA